MPEKRPEWVEAARVTFPSGRHADELCVTELAQVIWAANLAVVDFHPWPSRRRDTEHPDELRIDIDPQPGTTFRDGKRVAALVREVLAEIGYTGWPKTSGNRGIHVFCRIEPNWEFPVVRRAALSFAREVERRLPKKVTTAWWKEERGKRVFIDYNQNARDRTVASAYSVRGRPDATVSAPVTWDELPDVGDGGLLDGDDAGALREAGRRARGDRRRRVRPARAARVGRARRERRPRRGAVPAELPEDAGRAASRAAVTRAEDVLAGRVNRTSMVAAVDRLKRYAELIVRVGVNLQPGQTLFVNGQVEHAELARALARAGYEAGARYVDVRYADQHVRRAMIEHAEDEVLTDTPSWLLEQSRAIADNGALVMIAGDPYPDLLADLDGQRVGRARPRALLEALHEAQNARTVAWTIAAYPNERWAEQVFGEPDVERLWQAISDSVGLEEADPVAAWREHVATLRDRCAQLNERAFDRLHFRGPGTDLTVGLLPDAQWNGGGVTTRAGAEHVPNMPTEEVFVVSRLAAHGGHGPLDASARPRRHGRPRPRDVIRRG